MKIKFLGAARTVTGSMHVIECGGLCFAMDCGLFQGSKEIKERNYQDFKVNPQTLDFVILSHSHIDHIGLVPKLCKLGFKGNIYCSFATAELAKVMLPDSAHIQETEVERKNRKLLRAGKIPLEPIYTVEDAMKCLSQFRPVNYDELFTPAEGVEVRLRDAGHILGSSIVELWLEEAGKRSKIVFTGDLGQTNQPFIKDPTFIESADYVVMESTYGDRFHKDVLNRVEKLKQVIDETMKKGGNLIIPAFAVERTQDLLYDLNELYVKGDLDESIDVYIDSPLAIAATEIFKKYTQLFDNETKNFVNNGFHPLELPHMKYSHSQEESMELNNINRSIIISASGMCEAGRIKHHLKYNLWRPESTILFVGYQAEGTLGRKILDGEKIVTIFGEQVTVKADIRQIEAYSSHADQSGLLSWLKRYDGTPKTVFLVHGEEKAQQTLAELIRRDIHLQVVIPQWLDEYPLDESMHIEPKAVPMQTETRITNRSLEAEELYLQLRMKLNRFYQDSITGQKYEELIDKMEKITSQL
ncbi:MAG TPA: MBL fold metallo-hydrolase [Syntrophomonas sp.]|nr:MBL fold metallo-hydrolase [Syntrophomonas sp.]HRW12847.1 MBL fold metallo-hydrolase [Syntrophomonas sp.]